VPLIQSTLESSLLSLFQDPPSSASLCARAWGEAMSVYSSPILPVSSTATVASEALSVTLSSIFETSQSAEVTAAGMEAAFLSFAVLLGNGMLPGWVATPPVGLVGFSTLFSARPLTHIEAVSSFSSRIHLWMITGTATQVGTGTVVSWS